MRQGQKPLVFSVGLSSREPPSNQRAGVINTLKSLVQSLPCEWGSGVRREPQPVHYFCQEFGHSELREMRKAGSLHLPVRGSIPRLRARRRRSALFLSICCTLLGTFSDFNAFLKYDLTSSGCSHLERVPAASCSGCHPAQ